MPYISEIYTSKPKEYKSDLEKIAFDTLEKLDIKYERIDTDELITMTDCLEADKKLNVDIVKTLFLANQQKTKFYLLLMSANKRFNTKNFSKSLNISRFSFASEEIMKTLLHTEIGCCSIFSILLESAKYVQLVIDSDVLKNEFYGCSDGTKTCYMKLKTDDIFNKLIPFSGHKFKIIEI